MSDSVNDTMRYDNTGDGDQQTLREQSPVHMDSETLAYSAVPEKETTSETPESANEAATLECSNSADLHATLSYGFEAQQPTIAYGAGETDATLQEGMYAYLAPRAPLQARIPFRWEEDFECRIFAPGDVIGGIYEVCQILGEDQYSVSYLINHKQWNMQMGLRMLKPQYSALPEIRQIFSDECAQWIKMGFSSFAVNSLFAISRDKFIGIFHEYKTCSTFSSLAGQSPETIIIRFIQAFRALSHFHNNNIIHKNLKPENILIDETGSVILKDFSFSNGTRELLTKDRGDLPIALSSCAPPEIKNYNTVLQGPWSDVYSLGAIMYEVMWGKPLSAYGMEPAPAGVDIKLPVVSFISRCIAPVHTDRFFDAGEALSDLEHIFEKSYQKKLSHSNKGFQEKFAVDLNNRAVSLAELGFGKDALALWDEAAIIDPSDLNVKFNRDIYRWRSGLYSDLQIAEQWEILSRSNSAALPYLAMINIERDNCVDACSQLEQVVNSSSFGNGSLSSTGLESKLASLLDYARVRKPYSTRLLDLEKTEEDFPRSILNSDKKLEADWDYSGDIRIWDIGQRKQIKSIPSKMGKLNFVSITPDEEMIVYGSVVQNAPVIRHEVIAKPLSDNVTVPEFDKISGEHTCFDAIISENFKIAVSGSTKAAFEWDLWSGKSHRIFMANAVLTAIAISPDRRYVVAGDSNGHILFYRRGMDNLMASRQVYEGSSNTTAIAVSSDSMFAASSTMKNDLIIWNIETATTCKIFSLDGYYIKSMKFSSDNRLLVLRDSKNYIRIFDVEQGRCIRTISGAAGNVFSLRRTESDGFLVTSASRGALSLIHVYFPERRNLPPMFLSDVSTVEESRQINALFCQKLEMAENAMESGDYKSAMKLASEASAMPAAGNNSGLTRLLVRLAAHGRRHSLGKAVLTGVSVVKHPGAVILAAGEDGNSVFMTTPSFRGFRLFDTQRQAFTASYSHENSPFMLVLHPDGKKILSAHYGNFAALWDITSGKMLTGFPGHTDMIIHIAVSADGKYMLTGSRDKTVRLWELSTGRCLKIFRFEHPVFSIAFSGNGTHMALHFQNKTLKYMNIAAGEVVYEVLNVWTSFHIPGRYDVMVCDGNLIDVSTGEKLKSFGNVGGTRFYLSHDSRFIITGSSGGRFYLRDMEKGENIYTYDNDTDNVTSFNWSPDCSKVFASDNSGEIKVWTNEWESYIPEDENWEETARCYLQAFIDLHTPAEGLLPSGASVSDDDLKKAFTRKGVPYWTGEDFDNFLRILQKAGFGWIPRSELKAKLQSMKEEMAGGEPPVSSEAFSGMDSSQTLSYNNASSSDQTLAYGQAPHVLPESASAESVKNAKETLSAPQDATIAYTKGSLPEDDSAGSTPEWNPGDVIDNLYEIAGMIGAGGFGAVYKARHRHWNIDMAVKSLHRQLVVRQEQKNAFIRECQGWVNLGLHPNIVTCWYVRELEGLPRIFSEFMEGGSLEDWMDNDRIQGLGHIMDLAFQCLDGLSFAHKKGLVHRDIKPGNCLLTADGILKITDFGIASGLTQMSEQINPCAGVCSVGKTMMSPGGAIGTPAYMPPEQWDPLYAAMGPWTDIYAFGVMLFELCCGERPFDEGNEDPSILKVRHLTVEPPAPSEINPDVPELLSDFILKCLNKESDGRFQSCGEARRELEKIYEILTGEEYARPEAEEMELLGDSLNNRGVSLMDMGMKSEAVNAWDEALKVDPSNARVVYNRGITLWRSGETDDGAILDSLNRILTDSPSSADVHYFAGMILLERDDVDEAMNAFRKAYELSGGMKEALEGYVSAQLHKPESGGIIHQFEAGQGVYFNDMALSPDGLSLAVVCSGNVLKLWNLKTHSVVRSFSLNTSGYCVSFSPDGKKLAVGLSDGTVQLFEANTGISLRIFEKLSYEIFAVSISNTGQYIAACDRNGYGMVWDLSAGIKLSNFLCHCKPGIPIFWSSNDSCLLVFGPITGGSMGPIFIDVSTGKTVKRENKPDVPSTIQAINASAVSRNGKTGVSSHADGSLYLWDIETGNCLKKMQQRDDACTHVAFSPDVRWLFTSGKYLRVWEISTGRCVRNIPRVDVFYDKLIASPDGRTVLLARKPPSVKGAGNPFVQIWKPGFSNYKPVGSITLSKIKLSAEANKAHSEFNALLKKAEKAIRFRDIRKALQLLSKARSITGYERAPRGIELWEKLYPYTRKTALRGAWIANTLEGHRNTTYCLAFNREGTLLFSSGMDNKMILWDVEGGKVIASRNYGEGVNKVNFCPDGTRIITSSFRGDARIFNTAAFSLSGIVGKSGRSIRDARFSVDGSISVTGGDGAIVDIWNAKTGELIRELNKPPAVVDAVDISPDRQWVMIGYTDLVVKSIDEKTELRMQNYKGDYVKAGFFGADGATLFAGIASNSLYVYNAFDGLCIHHLQGFTSPVISIAAAADNRWLLTGMSNLSLWDLAIGQCYRVLDHKNAGPVAVTPDGRLAACSGEEGKIRIWTLDWELEYPEDCSMSEGAKPYIKAFVDGECMYNPPENTDSGSAGYYVTTARIDRLMSFLGDAGYGWISPSDVMSELKRIFEMDRGGMQHPQSSLISIIDEYRNGRIKPHVRTTSVEPNVSAAVVKNARDIHQEAQEILSRMKTSHKTMPSAIAAPEVLPQGSGDKTFAEKDSHQEKPEEKKSWFTKILGKFMR